jgi:8-oxo-dGTP pyrophosphatase MutT (NUDIX family)
MPPMIGAAQNSDAMERFVQLGFKVAARIRRVYWYVFRPRTFGVKCVVRHEGRWLMIRNSYGNGFWTLPGGAIHRGEQPAAAAIREVGEEVGVDLGSVEPVGSYESNREYKKDTVYCFVADVMSSDHRIDRREVIEADWFDPSRLPTPCARSVSEVRDLVGRR